MAAVHAITPLLELEFPRSDFENNMEIETRSDFYEHERLLKLLNDGKNFRELTIYKTRVSHVLRSGCDTALGRFVQVHVSRIMLKIKL